MTKSDVPLYSCYTVPNMKIQENVSLAAYSTMRVGGLAHFLTEVSSEDELLEALEFAASHKLRFQVIGQGSNSIFSGQGFAGLIIINRIAGVEITEDGGSLLLRCGGGEIWDDVVRQSVERGFGDIAALSLIPGTVGAAPVQNIGAYGQQISEVLTSVRAYDVKQAEFVVLEQAECGFFYRGSRFNTVDKGRYIITSVEMQLRRKTISAPFYQDVAAYFQQHGIDENTVTPAQLRQAVSTVRVIKLPDPKNVASCGSFFKNPLVSAEEFAKLQASHPELKAHQTDDGNLKLYGGQLIELAGLKDYHDPATGMATWKNQALVLVNEAAQTTNDVLVFKQKIIDVVEAKFDITLIQEPEFIT